MSFRNEVRSWVSFLISSWMTSWQQERTPKGGPDLGSISGTGTNGLDRKGSLVAVGSPLINAPWISTQGGTTYGVTSEVWQQMQQQHVSQQPVRLQSDHS